ncbi:MAG: nitroreductase/quinone reductase family protein [Parahaliea sp.]
MSRSLMLISFTGRNSGRRFTTPVRYVENDGVVRCFTSRENQWWRNLRGGAEVVLRIRGQNRPCRAIAIDSDPEQAKQWLTYYLGLFPQDAAYHDIRLNSDQSLVAEDLERASHRAIVVEASPIG